MKVAGVQPVDLWQSSQVLLVARWLALLPVALRPSWQEAQLPVIPVWLKVAGVQPEVLWQSSQALFVAICVVLLPVALRPSWQEAQLPVIPV